MAYLSDLSDEQWNVMRSYFEYSNGYGNRTKHPQRVKVNAILYAIKTGCQWRWLPKDFPPWKTIYGYYRRLCIAGVWEKVLAELVKRTRLKAGRPATPSLCIVDSQSVKTTGRAHKRGIDGGKKNQRAQATHRG